MADLVTLVIDKYDGSLKAEHGTGINMAPFVRHEWGEVATDMMWRIKRLADPHGVLAPNVVLTRDCPTAHLGLTKTLERLAARLADEVLVPIGTTCCGTAGDPRASPPRIRHLSHPRGEGKAG